MSESMDWKIGDLIIWDWTTGRHNEVSVVVGTSNDHDATGVGDFFPVVLHEGKTASIHPSRIRAVTPCPWNRSTADD